MTKKQIEKEIQRQAVLFEEKVLNGQFIRGDIKFVEFTEQWLATYGKDRLKPCTYKS